MPAVTLPLDRETAWRIGVYTGGEVIGDGLWKLPFIRALRSAFPNAHITWIARSHTVYASSLAPVVTGLLDEVLDDSGVARRSASLWKPLPPIERFDVLLDTQRTVWRALYLRRLTRGLLLSPAADYRLSQVKPPAGLVPTRHLAQLFVDWIGWLTGEPASLDRSIELPADVVAGAQAVLPDIDQAGEQPRYVGFVPGAGDTRKCWPLDRFITVAQSLMVDDPTIKPVFLLGPDEVDWQADIASVLPEALFPEQDESHWQGSQPGPLRAIAVAQRLQAAVSNDCGTGHMLAAGDTPLLSLFGPTEPGKFKPLNKAKTAVLAAQDFSEGSRDGDRDAMAQIPVDAVTQSLRDLLGVAEPGG